MAYLIGTDEAGYGPNLGPLVIATSAWHVPDDARERDLYDTLRSVVVAQPTDAVDRLAIADSKRLYRPGSDLGQLERALFTLLRINQPSPDTWRRLREMVCQPSPRPSRPHPWLIDLNLPLPTSAIAASTDAVAAACQQALQSNSIRLLMLKATVIEPEEFNAEVTRYDSKGALLSHRTLDLVADVINQLDVQPLRIVCDKHGGRNKYGPLLQPRFQDRLVRVVCEGRQASIYDVGTPQQPIEISFRVGGEAFLPSALASMLAKYLRELSMGAFNRYWQQLVPDLLPTAGYPGDAKRFWEQIRPRLRHLGIADHILWRCR